MEEMLKIVRSMIDELERVPGQPNIRRCTGLHRVVDFFLEYFVPREKLLDILEEEIMKDPVRYHRMIDRSLRSRKDT